MRNILCLLYPLSVIGLLLSGCIDSGAPTVISSDSCAENVGYDGHNTPRIDGEVYTWINNEAALRSIGAKDSAYPADGHYILGADIVLTEPVVPLPEFSGVLTGNCHEIHGFRIVKEQENQDHQGDSAAQEDSALSSVSGTGLFQSISELGALRYLTIVLAEDAEATPVVEGFDDVGVAVGENRGTISHVVVKATARNTARIEGQSRIGGLVGRNSGTITESTVQSLHVVGSGRDIGGLVGLSEETARISESRVEGGTVEGTGKTLNVGGFVGRNAWASYISDSTVNSITVENKEGVHTGGFVGLNNAASAVSTESDNYKAIVDSHAMGTVHGGKNSGGFVGSNIGVISDSDTSVRVWGKGRSGGFVGQHVTSIDVVEHEGFVVEERQKIAIYKSHAFGDVSACRENTCHDTVGGFAGLNRASVSSDFTIKESSARGSVKGKHHVGGFVGENRGSISSSKVLPQGGGVVGIDNVGGFVGLNEVSSIVRSSRAEGSRVEGQDSVGGFVGKNKGLVANSHAKREVTGSGQNIGGFAGRNEASSDKETKGLFENAVEDVDVIGRDGAYNVGGFVGYNQGSVGKSVVDGNSAQGFAQVGGFVGQNEEVIKDSYTTILVQGSSEDVGGFVGLNNGGNIEKSYSRGSVSGSAENSGGFAGEVDGGRVRNCYYNNGSDTPARVKTDSGIGLNSGTVESASDGGSFSEWTIATLGVWNLPAELQWPLLDWQQQSE